MNIKEKKEEYLMFAFSFSYYYSIIFLSILGLDLFDLESDQH